MTPIKVGICGLGTVGSGVVNVLQRNAGILSQRTGRDILITHIGARRDNPSCDTAGIKVSRDVFAVATDPEVDILIELIGGTDVAKPLVEMALEQGKSVVTANKALIAEFGNELCALAEQKGVELCFEAAVAGGIPILKTLREGLVANSIQSVAGIINGTGNFILTEMSEKGRDFSDVLKEAQALGYAEADPTFDVEGIDAAHKLVILASLAFGIPLDTKKAFTEGISQVATCDIDFAKTLGYRIKHLGIARKTEQGIELRVHPTLLPDSLSIAKVDGVLNAVQIETCAAGVSLSVGAGAGSEATASAVIADVADIARRFDSQALPLFPLGVSSSNISEATILPIEQCRSAFYLRFRALDKPGVMSGISRVFAEHNISIEALIQKGKPGVDGCVPIVVITDEVYESNLNEAVAEIKVSDAVMPESAKIRVESFAQ